MSRLFQYSPAISRRDAIGYSATRLHRALLNKGVSSLMVCDINSFASSPDGTIDVEGLIDCNPTTDDVIIYHYSFLDSNSEKILNLKSKKILVYHNVTPGFFFRNQGQTSIADICDLGKAVLPSIAERVDISVSDSDYNAREVPGYNTEKSNVIPVFYNDNLFRASSEISSSFLSKNIDYTVRIVFIGRIVPNKRIDQIIRLANYIKKILNLNVKVKIFGKIWNRDYFRSLGLLAVDLDLQENISFEINRPAHELRNALSSADAFVSMSEHEGFMVPLLEAFATGCPVVALSTGAVTETCGDAGCLVETFDFPRFAGLIVALKNDRDLRNAVVRRQSRRAEAFSDARTWLKWRELLQRETPQIKLEP